MIRNKFNKKTVNNLILGSLLYGSSASISTTAQATQRSSQIREYNLAATQDLEDKLAARALSMEEGIELVRDRQANPNVQGQLRNSSTPQRKSLTLLEEAILSRFPEALEIFIAHGANACKVSEAIKNVFGKETTLLHLALLTPKEMKALDKFRSVDRPDDQQLINPIERALEQRAQAGAGRQKTIPSRYIPEKIIKLLVDELSKKRVLTSTINAKDKNDKTILDWAIERFLVLALNPEILTVDHQTPIANLKIPILNLKIKESDQQMKNEYENIVSWLSLDIEKTYHQKPTRKQENDKSLSLILQLESLPTKNIPIGQKAGWVQALSLEYLQRLLRQMKNII